MSKETMNHYIYWLDKSELNALKPVLQQAGLRLAGVLFTPCEVLRATGNKVLYAGPELWSRLCVRQGSWYRDSANAGKTMVVSENKLPDAFDDYLDAQLTQSGFQPQELPSEVQLQDLVESDAYRGTRPDAWERKTWRDAVLFKAFFSATGFWGRGDNLRKYWLSHRANHANFLAKQFTADIEGEQVPYTVAENKGVCSSCVEFFNVSSPQSRKLVRACPGAVTFGRAKRDVYYDVKPVSRAA